MRMLRASQVVEMLGVSRSTIRRMCRDGAFPLPKQVSPNRIAWTEDAILDWVAELPDASRAPEPEGEPEPE